VHSKTKSSILFEGETLESAYKKATLEYNCSLSELQSEVIQTPSNGFLGLFKKNAIIKVYGSLINDEEISNKNKDDFKIEIKDISNDISHNKTPKINELDKINSTQKNHKKEEIFDTFYENSEEENKINSNDSILIEIKKDINNLFSKLNFDIEEIDISFYDEKTIFIKFDGVDSALLIGKEGYRYKALSYILFNWIHSKYNYMIRLEIAKFLNEQEKNVYKYLEDVIINIKQNGFYKTKVFDGILVHIALSKLREEFPNKYVAVKTNQKGQKYILVNEYKK